MVGTGRKKVYLSKHGLPAEEDDAAARVSPAEFMAVVVPGGYAPDRLRADEGVLHLVQEVFNAGGVAAAICHGPWVLISAGIVRGKTVTCLRTIKDDVINAGAVYVDQPVAEDGNMVTSRLPEDLPAISRAVFARLERMNYPYPLFNDK